MPSEDFDRASFDAFQKLIHHDLSQQELLGVKPQASSRTGLLRRTEGSLKIDIQHPTVDGRELQGARTLPKIEVGSRVPDFSLDCVNGEKVQLSDLLGSKVMVCFYNFAHCPGCAYSIKKLIGEHKKLAWASKLKVVTIFRTDIDMLKLGLTDENAPIPRVLGGNCYPFMALADPEGKAASLFKVKTSSLIKKAIANYKHMPYLLFNKIAMKEALFNSKDAITLLHSEFLVDEDGVLVDATWGKKLGDALSCERVNCFLIYGQSLSGVLRARQQGVEGRGEPEKPGVSTQHNILARVKQKKNTKK